MRNLEQKNNILFTSTCTRCTYGEHLSTPPNQHTISFLDPHDISYFWRIAPSEHTHHLPTVIMETLNMSCFHFATMACAINRAKHIQKFLSNLVRAHASHELAGVETLNMQTWMHDTRTEIMRKTPMIIIIENIRRSTALLLSCHEHILFVVRLIRRVFRLHKSSSSTRIRYSFCVFVSVLGCMQAKDGVNDAHYNSSRSLLAHTLSHRIYCIN